MIPQKYVGIDPYGNTSTMSKIDISETQYLPLAKAKETGSHVLTFWIMSNANKDIVIKMGDIDKTESVSTTWKCISIVEQLDADEHVDIKLPSGTYYIWHAKLERGTKPTDWTVAPEDTDKQIAEVIQRTAELTISLDGITESVSRLETEGEAMNTRLKAAEQKITPESIVSTVVDSDGFGNKVVSEINQTSDEVKISADKIRLEGYTIADDFEATNLTVSGSSKIGGFVLSDNSLVTSSDTGSKLSEIQFNLVNQSSGIEDVTIDYSTRVLSTNIDVFEHYSDKDFNGTTIQGGLILLSSKNGSDYWNVSINSQGDVNGIKRINNIDVRNIATKRWSKISRSFTAINDPMKINEIEDASEILIIVTISSSPKYKFQYSFPSLTNYDINGVYVTGSAIDNTGCSLWIANESGVYRCAVRELTQSGQSYTSGTIDIYYR